MTETIIKSAEKLNSTDRLEVKYKVNRTLFLAKLLDDSLKELTEEKAITDEVKIQGKLLKDNVERYVEGVVSLYGAPTVEWLERQFETDKLKQTLPLIITTMAKVQGEVPEMIYHEVANLFHHLVGYAKRGRRLDYEKYALLLQFIVDEMDAELSKGTVALSVVDSPSAKSGRALAFNLCSPKSNFKEEVSFGSV